MIKDTGHKKWLQVPLDLIVKWTLKTTVAVQTPHNRAPHLMYYDTYFFVFHFSYISQMGTSLCDTKVKRSFTKKKMNKSNKPYNKRLSKQNHHWRGWDVRGLYYRWRRWIKSKGFKKYKGIQPTSMRLDLEMKIERWASKTDIKMGIEMTCPLTSKKKENCCCFITVLFDVYEYEERHNEHNDLDLIIGLSWHHWGIQKIGGMIDIILSFSFL